MSCPSQQNKVGHSLQAHLGAHRAWQALAPRSDTAGVAFQPPPQIFPLLQETEYLILHGARHADTLIDWFFLILPYEGKSQSCWAGPLPSFAVRGFHRKSWQCKCLQQMLFSWPSWPFYFEQTAAFISLHHLAIIFLNLLSEPLMLLPGENKHKKFLHMDV